MAYPGWIKDRLAAGTHDTEAVLEHGRNAFATPARSRNVRGHEEVRTNLGRFASGVQRSMLNAAEAEARDIQSEMQSLAAWNNITGLARAGLRAEVQLIDPRAATAINNPSQPASIAYKSTGSGGVTIVAYGLMPWNLWLEVRVFSRRGSLAVILPTLQRHAPGLIRRVQQEISRLGA